MKMKPMKNKKYLHQKFSRKVLVPQNTADFMSRVSKSYVPFTGLKLPQKSREKSLLPPAELGRSEILAGRSEILAVAETCRDLSRELVLLFLYLSPHFTFHPIYVQCSVLFTFIYSIVHFVSIQYWSYPFFLVVLP